MRLANQQHHEQYEES